jgi:hypothetical protein
MTAGRDHTGDDPSQAAREVEHALLMSGGDMQVRNPHPEIDRIYPLAQGIEHHQRHGAKVCRRTIIVVSDWEEVPPAGE